MEKKEWDKIQARFVKKAQAYSKKFNKKRKSVDNVIDVAAMAATAKGVLLSMDQDEINVVQGLLNSVNIESTATRDA